jgi:hypothetical protein
MWQAVAGLCGEAQRPRLPSSLRDHADGAGRHRQAAQAPVWLAFRNGSRWSSTSSSCSSGLLRSCDEGGGKVS